MCTSPLTCYQNPDGGKPIFGWAGESAGLPIIKLPCGKCPECVKEYYTSWATRGSRELKRWPSSVFITLTYDDEHLPHNRSLDKTAVQKFIKRVKKRFKSTKENPIRQIYCGEYGEKTLRPHYHAILFNTDFTDACYKYTSDQGYKVYTSEILSDLWPFGNAEFGYATPQTIAYLFKYILKKKTRKEKKHPLMIQIDDTIYDVAHEFIEASRNPGIGAHMRDSSSIKKGFLTVNGVKQKIPKYYLNYLKEKDPSTYEKISESRTEYALRAEKISEKNLKAREAAQKKLLSAKKRL